MTDAPVSALGLTNADAEIAVLHAMRIDTNAAIDLAQTLTPQDFYDTRRQVVFEAIRNLLMGIEPIDTSGIHAECTSILRERKLKIVVEKDYIDSLTSGDIRRYAMYGNTVKKLAWLRQAGDFAFWLVQELQERPQPDELFTAAQERWQLLAPKKIDTSFVYGWDTIRIHADSLRQRIQQHEEGTTSCFDWPWVSWNKKIRPLPPGMVGILAAPDGQGKSMYLEQIAEYWASIGHQVVMVHLEDALDYKLNRRSSRHSGVSLDKIEDGDLTAQEQRMIYDADQRISDWAGCLHYYHAAGKSMSTIIRELETRVSEGVCTAVVFDYLDKVQPTRGQAQVYGDNTWERQANDMELLKSFAENLKVPVLTATQGNKDMQGGGTQTRKNIQGSGQKSQKAQLVLILTRELVGDEGLRDKNGKVLAEKGEYSPIANIRVDKQNRGKTGELQQYIVGETFVIRDIQFERKDLN
jgi:replicative DNA helicase